MGDITPHFSWSELDKLGAASDPVIRQNIRKTANFLEIIRSALGDVPLVVNSGYRPEWYNRKVGGSETSSHLTGLAADVKPVGITQYRAYKVLAASDLPPFDQIIYYPISGHIHIGIGSQMRGEHRIKVAENYRLVTNRLADLLQGSKSSTALLLALVVVGAVLILSD